MNIIKEGKIKKGGQNLKPTTTRPAPPHGQSVSSINQCDGCKRKLTLKDGIHYDVYLDKDDHRLDCIFMFCTADRYEKLKARGVNPD